MWSSTDPPDPIYVHEDPLRSLSQDRIHNPGPSHGRPPTANWIRDVLLDASRELLFAAAKVRNPVGSSIEDQAAAAWHVRTSQALLDHCVQHLDDLDDEDPPGYRPRPGGPLVPSD